VHPEQFAQIAAREFLIVDDHCGEGAFGRLRYVW